MNKYLILSLFSCMMFFYSCSEENNLTPVTADPTIPGQVTNVRTEALPGAVKLTYDMPAGQNLSYVKAECLMKNGVVRQAKASSYINNLTLEGFGDESEYTVNLYSFNRSEKSSAPTTVRVTPLEPNFRIVRKNLQLIGDFSGATVIFDNPNEADLAINIIYVDSTGFWNDGESFYTKRKEGEVTLRGFKPEKTTFGVFLRDRWDNATDTLVEEVTPLFEKELDRLKFREARLANDAPYGGWGWVMTNLWNGTIGTPGYVIADNGPLPQWLTMDLGVEKGATLSRIAIWNRNDGTVAASYAAQCVKKFEVWGCLDTPTPDGSWDCWTHLLDAEIIKPSGLPMGVASDEDAQAILAGFDFKFPGGVPLVRYIRIKVTATWGGDYIFNFSGLKFWGAEPDDLNTQ